VKRLLRIAIVSLAAVMVLFAAFHFMRAQGNPSGSVTLDKPLMAESSVTSDPVGHYLERTYMVQGVPETTEAAGALWIDPSATSFRCWRPCTLEASITAGLGNVDYASNTFDYGYSVDGGLVLARPIGTVPSDYSPVMGTWSESFSLSPGAHTVQSRGFTIYGAELYDYHIDYKIYEP